MGSHSRGGRGLASGGVGASALLPSDQSQGVKAIKGHRQKRWWGALRGIPRTESEGRGSSHHRGNASEGAPNPALPTPLFFPHYR